jgi:hypothetical protein
LATIRNFGHYWSRNLIDWGYKGSAGSLLGARKVNAEESDADFRNQIGIYVLYDENREAVYVGQAGRGNSRLFDRLRHHSRGPMRERWASFSWFGFLDIGPDGYLIEREDSAIPSHAHTDALDQFEAILLQVIEPRLAKRGPNWNGTTEYFQFVEEEATTLDHLWHEMQELKALVEKQAKVKR